MKRLPMLVSACLLTLLTACNEFDNATPGTLPPPPADIAVCLRTEGVTLPKGRGLTIAEVEHYWKQDRLRLALVRRCGARLHEWYQQLRTDWR